MFERKIDIKGWSRDTFGYLKNTMVIMTTKKPTVESRIFNVPKCIVFDVPICIFNVPKCIFNVPKESYQDISSHFHSVVSDIKLEDVCVSDRCNQIEDDIIMSGLNVTN